MFTILPRWGCSAGPWCHPERSVSWYHPECQRSFGGDARSGSWPCLAAWQGGWAGGIRLWYWPSLVSVVVTQKLLLAQLLEELSEGVRVHILGHLPQQEPVPELSRSQEDNSQSNLCIPVGVSDMFPLCAVDPEHAGPGGGHQDQDYPDMLSTWVLFFVKEMPIKLEIYLRLLFNDCIIVLTCFHNEGEKWRMFRLSVHVTCRELWQHLL